MRVALVGLGYIAELHYQAALKAGADGIIGCDVNPAFAEAFASRPGVEAVVTDLDDVLALKPDVAHVLTPPNVHFPVATRFVAAGIDVLLEKPMCDRSKDARRLISQADETGALLATNHNLLFYRIWETLKAAVENGTIGALRSIDVRTRRPFPPLRANNTAPWAMRASRNILFEVAPLVLDRARPRAVDRRAPRDDVTASGTAQWRAVLPAVGRSGHIRRGHGSVRSLIRRRV